ATNTIGEAVINYLKSEVIAIEQDASTLTKKVFVKRKTCEGEYVVQFTARKNLEVGDQVAPGAALNEASIQPKRWLENT
ncbi:hypothetical protein ACJBWA_11230, partial [Streptococcus suis]